MNMRKIIIGLIFCLAIISVTQIASPQPPEGMFPPPPGMIKMGLSGICADQQYLYIMAGGKILQYEIVEMTLLHKVDLPDPPLPSSPPPNVAESDTSRPPHPMGGPPHGIWADNGFLHVLAGPVVYKYSIPDLLLQSTVELPKPELP